jgi:hypothetical protein
MQTKIIRNKFLGLETFTVVLAEGNQPKERMAVFYNQEKAIEYVDFCIQRDKDKAAITRAAEKVSKMVADNPEFERELIKLSKKRK